MAKTKHTEETEETPPVKKIKKSVKKVEADEEKSETILKVKKDKKTEDTFKTKTKKASVSFKNKKLFKGKSEKVKSFEKPTDWNEFKKKKKELQTKRKQTKNLYTITVEAKKIGETLRRKTLKKGPEERKKLTEELHSLLGNQQNYPKFVLTHDMARIVQYLLKFSSEKIRREIAQELIATAPIMLQSKYAKFCVKHMLKYGDTKTRSEVIRACYGHAVKLASHAVSSAIFDYGYTTWATPQEKRHLVQEFYGDLYKQSKDDSLTHVRDVYKNSSDMKTSVLNAIKANLSRIMNKELLDSHLVQTVIMQYLQECNAEDRTELISQLVPHIVVISNSKEGATAAMLCFWHSSNKDRKVAMKSLKEHVIDMCKHEHSHNTIIAVIDSIDDTVLLNKILLQEIISNATDIVSNEWGRRVLLWLVAPGDQSHFHPSFINELNQGRENSTSKKESNVRRNEIIGYCVDSLLQQINMNVDTWLKSASVAIVTFAILKAGSGDNLEVAYKNIANIITNPDWKIIEEEKETPGIEHAGFHMLLKKLLQHDKNSTKQLFAPALVENLSEKTIKKWVKSETGCNRACFFLVHIIENSSEDIHNQLKLSIGKKIVNILEEKEKTCKGAAILLKKIS